MGISRLFDSIAEAFSAAITDVRHKVVEEGWFGRTVTPSSDHEPTMSEALGWTTHAQRMQAGIPEPDRSHAHQADRDRELDR